MDAMGGDDSVSREVEDCEYGNFYFAGHCHRIEFMNSM
jgi:hypothetical protein